MNKLSKFAALPGKEKLLFLEAFQCLVSVRILLTLLTFKRILPLLRQKESIQASKADPALIRNAVARASVATPWTSTCLMKSMAARWMLKRRRLRSHMGIGMAKDIKGKLVMHAWIGVDGLDIVGKDQTYQELFVFE